MLSEDLPFQVVRTNGHDEILVRAGSLNIGQAAYETAIRLFPKDRIQYRNGARIIAQKEKGGPQTSLTSA